VDSIIIILINGNFPNPDFYKIYFTIRSQNFLSKINKNKKYLKCKILQSYILNILKET